ncbi:hypothetical protein [Nocardia sp. NPDC050175]|uniref:hypothetical protein n=1 Tax=Nocardia sp. NPDC050175 TaxID=3364317 RepID=UPI0037BE0768
MTRDLPFDDETTEAAERTGDTAYRVATGVARVARAGAYVTGGALVAANGGGVPAHPNSSHADSRNAGWAHNTDPDSDIPSPVITFPDLVVEPAPLTPPHATNSTVAHPTPGFGLPGGDHGANLPLPTLNGDYSGTDAGFALPGTDGGQSGMGLPSVPGGPSGQHGMELPGTSNPGFGLPGTSDATGQPGMGLPGTPNGIGLPGTDAGASNGLQLPGTGGVSNDLDLPGGHGFGLPGHGLGQAGHGFGLPGTNGFVAPGSGAFDLPGSHAASAAGGPFDGVGDGGGDPLGVFVGTQWSVDFGIGPQGIYFNSEMKVDVGVGHVGDQLDQFTDFLGSGLGHVPDGTGRSVTDPAMTGHSHHSHPGVVGGLTTPGSNSSTASTAQPVVQPLAAPAPVMSAAVAPVAAAAPVVAVAPVASAAQPVAATPLQTTIQPDAATTPIANVFTAPEGPSVLTVPAAATPVIFDHARPTPVLKPTTTPVTDTTKHSDGSVTTPNTPTTITKTVPVPVVPTDVATPSAPKTPDITTKVPGAGSPSTGHGGISTGPDVPTTKVPPATGSQPTHVPTTSPDDDGVTTPGTGTGTGPSTGNGGASGGVTTQPTVPTKDVPTVPTRDIPTADVPTHDVPVPTHDVPVPTYQPPVQTQAPVPTQAPTYKPPTTIDPKPHAIADPISSAHMVDSSMVPIQDHAFYDDHSTLAFASGGGLSGALMPEATMAEIHHMVPGGLDIALM